MDLKLRTRRQSWYGEPASRRTETPRLVQEGQFIASSNGNTSFSITKDGTRFLRIQPVGEEPANTHIEVVLNWFATLKRRATGRVE